MAELLTVPQGDFTLQRLPLRNNELLRPWDAADEYLLDYLADSQLPTIGSNTLVVNDNFGALTIALAKFTPYAVSDSYLSQAATRMNALNNGIGIENLRLFDSLSIPSVSFDLVVIKVPKTLAWFEDSLHRLRPLLQTQSIIIVAGMVKHLPSSVWRILENLVGPTKNSLAKKKARLIFAHFNPQLHIPTNPYPLFYPLENSEFTLCNHANVFSREQLDIGTRFFLQHIPHSLATDIVDLGCGNGVVGLIAAMRNPNACIHFVDESFMAIASAQHNFTQAFSTSRTSTYTVGDALTSFSEQSMDLILCNPPFHQQQSVGDHLAMNMFKQAFKTLRRQGELWVIGNRHLGYQSALHRLFGNTQLIANNPKFVIIKAIRH